MNIILHRSFSVSEASEGIKNSIIYPMFDAENEDVVHRLYLISGGDTKESLFAGQIVCDCIKTYFRTFQENTDMTADFIEKAIRMSEISLSEYQKEFPKKQYLTTRLTLFYVASNCIYLCQIGESYVYQIRNNQIVYRSIDSSAARKIQGSDLPVEIQVTTLKDIQENDQFFICNGRALDFRDEAYICITLSQQNSSEDKLYQIKDFFMHRYNNHFSALLIPIGEKPKTPSLMQRINTLIYSFV